MFFQRGEMEAQVLSFKKERKKILRRRKTTAALDARRVVIQILILSGHTDTVIETAFRVLLAECYGSGYGPLWTEMAAERAKHPEYLNLPVLLQKQGGA